MEAIASACSKCRSAIGVIERSGRAAGVEVEIVETEFRLDIERLGVRSTQAVIIDGRIVHTGGLPSHDEVQGWLRPGPMGFLRHRPTRHLLFAGKGGVGKTSADQNAAASDARVLPARCGSPQIGVSAAFARLEMWMAVFADMGASLPVVFNGLRLRGDVGHRSHD